MHQYVSFLRGVNVGGRIIKMVELKDCYEQAGFSDVKTLLQSGNVSFSSKDQSTASVKKVAEDAVSKRFEYDAKIHVLPQRKLSALVRKCPFKDRDGFHRYILFTSTKQASALLSHKDELDQDVEAINPGNNVVYWQVQKGMTLKTPFAKILTKAEFRDTTNRNINTVAKLI